MMTFSFAVLAFAAKRAFPAAFFLSGRKMGKSHSIPGGVTAVAAGAFVGPKLIQLKDFDFKGHLLIA